ncbi:MAG: DUF1918 domain-containing protein [Longispora sp.]|nr:DUF1918 domain-containing protein [Longispora sp. (in: high G+C Gram-positive bacteria)]
MHASIGDLIRFHSNTVETQDRHGEILEVRGPNGAPPYLVKFSDDHEALIYPGPDSIIEPQRRARHS